MRFNSSSMAAEGRHATFCCCVAGGAAGALALGGSSVRALSKRLSAVSPGCWRKMPSDTSLSIRRVMWSTDQNDSVCCSCDTLTVVQPGLFSRSVPSACSSTASSRPMVSANSGEKVSCRSGMSETEDMEMLCAPMGLIGYRLTSRNTAHTIRFRRTSRGEGKNRICL